MTITYSTKAKDDLVKIDWKIRHRIIEELNHLERDESLGKLKKISDTTFYKINFLDHLVIGTVNSDKISIITVVEKKKLSIPR